MKRKILSLTKLKCKWDDITPTFTSTLIDEDNYSIDQAKETLLSLTEDKSKKDIISNYFKFDLINNIIQQNYQIGLTMKNTPKYRATKRL